MSFEIYFQVNETIKKPSFEFEKQKNEKIKKRKARVKYYLIHENTEFLLKISLRVLP